MQTTIDGKPSILANIISFLFFVGLTLSFFYSNTLVKVKGKQMLINKEDAINSLKCFYGDLTFNISSSNILRDVKPATGLKSGRCITVIFDKENVYFHIATLGRGNVISPYLVLFNYKKCEEIARHFEKLQSENTSSAKPENK